MEVRDIPRPQKQSELPVKPLTLADDPFLDQGRETQDGKARRVASTASLTPRPRIACWSLSKDGG